MMIEDWVECRIVDISDRIHYGFTSSSKTEGNGAKYLRITDIQNGTVNWANVPVCEIKAEELEKFQLSENDLVFARTGGTVGKSYLIKSDVPQKAVFASYLIRIIINKDVWPKFIYLFFQSLNYWSQIELGKTGLKTNVNAQILSKIRFPLPPLPIQRAIVAKIESLFSSLDSGIADLEKAQAQLNIYRQAIIVKGVTGELTSEFRGENPKLENSESVYQKIQSKIDKAYEIACIKAKRNGERKPRDQRKNKKSNNVTTDLPKLPDDWRYYRLEDITYLVTDGTHHTPKYTKQGVKFLSVKNVRPFYIRDEQIKYISKDEHEHLIKRCKPENGDILYTKVGATYGYACKVNLAYEFSIFVSLCLIKPVYEYLTSDFLELLMNSELVFKQARQRVSGSGVPDLHLIEIRDFKVPLPSIQEQHQIVREIESRLSVCDKVAESISQSLEKAQALRQSILKKAFEGKLLTEAEIAKCKQEADYEPASVLLERIQQEREASQKSLAKSKKK